LISFLCKNKFPNQNELSRKIVHIGTGPIIPLAYVLEVNNIVAISISMIVTISLIINYKFRIIQSIEAIQRKSYGTITYAISITLLLILYWPEKASAISAGVLVMSFGDGLAGLIGSNISSPSWKVFGGRKSIAGTLTMIITTILIIIGVIVASELPINPLRIITLTAIAVLLEQISVWGLDNLSVPLAIAFCWEWVALV
tara:strand:+ start:2055 stop:2654 length:600 start_codon:yes stop_codon:yes gene_type:complete